MSSKASSISLSVMFNSFGSHEFDLPGTVCIGLDLKDEKT